MKNANTFTQCPNMDEYPDYCWPQCLPLRKRKIQLELYDPLRTNDSQVCQDDLLKDGNLDTPTTQFHYWLSAPDSPARSSKLD